MISDIDIERGFKTIQFLFSTRKLLSPSCCEDMRTLAIIFVLTTLVTFNIGIACSFLLLHEKRVILQCLNNFMLLKIDLQEIPKIKPSSLHLRHLSCKPHHVTNTTALFKVPLKGCGTTRGTKDQYIKFSNAVENSLSLNESRLVIVRHVPEFHFPFMCYYRPKYLITVQEGERHGTGNDSAKRPRAEGHANRLSSVPNETSSTGKLLLCLHSTLPVVLLLLIAVCG